MTLKEIYLEQGISEEIIDKISKYEEELKERFSEIDKRAELNQLKVLNAFREARVSAGCMESSTGYGYDDLEERF